MGESTLVELLPKYRDAGFTVTDDGHMAHIYLKGTHLFVVQHWNQKVYEQELAYTLAFLYWPYEVGYAKGVEEYLAKNSDLSIPATTAEENMPVYYRPARIKA